MKHLVHLAVIPLAIVGLVACGSADNSETKALRGEIAELREEVAASRATTTTTPTTTTTVPGIDLATAEYWLAEGNPQWRGNGWTPEAVVELRNGIRDKSAAVFTQNQQTCLAGLVMTAYTPEQAFSPTAVPDGETDLLIEACMMTHPNG